MLVTVTAVTLARVTENTAVVYSNSLMINFIIYSYIYIFCIVLHYIQYFITHKCNL